MELIYFQKKTSLIMLRKRFIKMATNVLPAVYWLVLWLACCLILVSIFYSNIQHQKRVDKIFDDYYKEMYVINGR